MAHDGYSKTNDPPPGYDPSDTHPQHPQSYYTSDGFRARSRESSKNGTELRLPQEQPGARQPLKPIAEAVNTAFDNAHVPGISHEVMTQITQNVIEQLKKTGSLGGAQTPTSQNHQQPLHPPATPRYPPPPSQQHNPPPTSPTAYTAGSPPSPARNVHTPPSPQRHTEQRPDSPDPRAPGVCETANMHRAPEEKRPASDLSNHSDTQESRPKPAKRALSSKEETTLEKIWGPLFDGDGKPTNRLSQFLRGLAVHMIEDYEPKHSLVVTPNKMVKFYEDVRILQELYPWHIVFDDDQSSISRMYRQLRIQHHLVQEKDHLHERPDIPALTPDGFERWATLMILAHPEEEFERIKLAALNMPINNPDDKKERFPKDLSRRLFPKHENFDIRELLISAMEAHAKITVERPLQETTTPRADQAQHHQRRGSETHSHHSFTDASVNPESAPPPPPPPPPGNIERERKPYSRAANETVIDDTNPRPAVPQPIERERKPYSVAPGNVGRVYEEPESGRATVPATAPSQHPPPPPGGPPPSLHRSSSAASRPINIAPLPPGGPAAHKMSTSELTPPPQTNQPHLGRRASVRRPIRNHSPSASVGAAEPRRSEGDIRGFQPSSYDPPSLMANHMAMREREREREGLPAGHHSVDTAYDEDARRYGGREAEMRRGEYMRGGSPSRRYEVPPERRSTYNEEDFYRVPSRRDAGVYR